MNQPPQDQGARRMVGLVAATGGPRALLEILGGLPRDFPLPILVVMCMHVDYLRNFVAVLGERSSRKVTVAEDGDVPQPGEVYVASGDPDLLIVQGRLRLQPGGSDDQSKNVLFRSMARDLGPGAIAVVLTGMGRDGAEGLKEVRDVGGYTIAQDEETSLVPAAPRFAIEINAACEVLPLNEIASRLMTLANCVR